MIESVYKADVVRSCVNNPLQPIMLVFWNAKEQGVAVVETRYYNGVCQDFGSMFYFGSKLSDLCDEM